VKSAILLAAILSFLGLGVQPPTPEWGKMVSDGRSYLMEAPHVSLFPGLAIFVAVIACLFNVSGVELLLHSDLDSNRELRDGGIVNVVSSVFGGIPGYHALSLTAAQLAASDSGGW
jgi:MFS superfamily sulfate permease-like transporter